MDKMLSLRSEEFVTANGRKKEYIFYYEVEDQGFPDPDEFLVQDTTDYSIIEADMMYDAKLYNMAYTTDTGFVNLNKIIRNL